MNYHTLAGSPCDCRSIAEPQNSTKRPQHDLVYVILHHGAETGTRGERFRDQERRDLARGDVRPGMRQDRPAGGEGDSGGIDQRWLPSQSELASGVNGKDEVERSG